MIQVKVISLTLLAVGTVTANLQEDVFSSLSQTYDKIVSTLPEKVEL